MHSLIRIPHKAFEKKVRFLFLGCLLDLEIIKRIFNMVTNRYYYFFLSFFIYNSVRIFSQDVLLSPLKSADDISSKYSPEYINRNSINNSSSRGFNMILMEDYNWEWEDDGHYNGV